MAPPDSAPTVTPAARPSDEATDHELVAIYADASRSRGDRERAFHLLVKRHQRRLFGVCMHLLGSAADAEDAVQETFIRLARRADSFRGDSQVSTWLYRIAHNVATDRLRYEARRPATAVDDLSSVAGDAPADDQLGASETAAMLREALAQLDKQSRQLLLLIAVDDLSYEEASAATGLPVGTIKSRVSRARVRLGTLLDRSVDGEERGSARSEPPNTAEGHAAARPRGPPRSTNRSEPDPTDRRPT